MSRLNCFWYTVMDSPIGKISAAATAKGLCWISFDTGEASLLSLKNWGKRWLLCEQIIMEENEILKESVRQLGEYFRGERREFELPLDIQGSAFQKLVWNQLRRIPYGEVRSYKDIALALGAGKAVRAVGGANNKNPLSIVIPCHRVIGSNGALVGYGGGLSIKEYLLRLEDSLPADSNRKAQ